MEALIIPSKPVRMGEVYGVRGSKEPSYTYVHPSPHLLRRTSAYVRTEFVHRTAQWEWHP